MNPRLKIVLKGLFSNSWLHSAVDIFCAMMVLLSGYTSIEPMRRRSWSVPHPHRQSRPVVQTLPRPQYPGAQMPDSLQHPALRIVASSCHQNAQTSVDFRHPLYTITAAILE